MSSPRWISNVMTSRPSVRAVAWTSPVSSTTVGLPTFAKTANRPRPGTTSRNSSRRLPTVSTCWSDRPVTLLAGSSQTRDQANADWIAGRRENDGNDRRRLLGSQDPASRPWDHDINVASDELGRNFSEALAATLRPPILDRDGATLDPAEFAQPLNKDGEPLAMG